MTTYRTVVVGTDGSESSLRAVDRAATIAADSDAKLASRRATSRNPTIGARRTRSGKRATR